MITPTMMRDTGERNPTYNADPPQHSSHHTTDRILLPIAQHLKLILSLAILILKNKSEASMIPGIQFQNFNICFKSPSHA
jgi:hypothetical protein